MIIYPKSWNKTKKYLTYGHLSNKPGFLHQSANLNTVCLEATLANRIPVLSKKFTLSKIHNPAGSISSSWDRYWDLKKTKAYIYRYYPFPKHVIHQATYSVPTLWLDDLSDWMSKNPHRVTSAKELIKADDTCKVIYRKPSVSIWSWSLRDFQPSSLGDKVTKKLYKLIQYGYSEQIFFHRKPSVEVWAVVDDIIKQLGSNFWAIHIRRNDVLKRHSPLQTKHASNMSWVIGNLKVARMDRNTPLFVMTDEQDSSYLLPLQEEFNIIRATDFKSYKKIITKYPNDNFLCFCIERLIYLQARRRYKTAAYRGEAFEFMPFLKPVYERLNYLPPYCPLPVNCKKRYFSCLSLERKYRLSNKWPALLSLKYRFAQRVIHLRLSLSRRLDSRGGL